MAGFLAGVGSLLGSYLDFRSNERTNLTNWNMQHETNMNNMQLNQENIAFQERENAINRAREDDAVRRRANDLTGAGLSKTLAAGDAASANAMQAPQNTFAMQAPKFQAYKGFETAAYHRKQAEIADKELDVEWQNLENEKFKAEETARHNRISEEHEQAVIDENRRFHDIENEWKNAELNQNSEFHNDSMELSWAKQALDERLGLSEIESKEHQNVWYDAQVKLSESQGKLSESQSKYYDTQVKYLKSKDKREFFELTAQLAESDARVGLYLSEKNLNEEQIDYLKKESKYIGYLTAEKVAEIKHLNAQSREVLASAYTKLYNLWVARKDKSKTTDQTVSESVATENKVNRHSGLLKTGIGVAGGIAGIALGAFMKGSGAGGAFKKKMLTLDDIGWIGLPDY